MQTLIHTHRYMILLLLALILNVVALSPANAADKIGVIGAVSGQVTAKSGAGVRPLKVGDAIYLNDQISSSAGAKAQVMFLDKSALMINANSVVTVDRFIYNPASQTGELTLQSAKGALRFIGGALSKKKPVKIKTPVATIGIRGGIADAHIGAGGVTDAIFVYGEELTMQNQNGQVISVTEIGQGLSLNTPTGMPAPLPPAKVAAYMSTFDAAPAKKEQGDTQDGSTPPPPAPGDQQEPAENDPNGEGSQGTAEEGEPIVYQQGEPDEQQQADGSDPFLAPIGEPDEEGTMALMPEGGMFEEQQMHEGEIFEGQMYEGEMFAGEGSEYEAAGTFGMYESEYTIGGLPPLPWIEPSFVQDSQRDDNEALFVDAPFTPEQEGVYVLTRDGVDDPLSGGLAEFQGHAEGFSGRLVQAHPYPEGPRTLTNLPRPALTGYSEAMPGDVWEYDGRSFTGHTFVTPDESMYYYNLHELGGTDRIAMIFGQRIDSSQWSSLADSTQQDSIAIGNHGLAFYDFLPDLAQQGSFFDYNVADSRLLPAGTVYGNQPGLIVDWQHNRFLTGSLIWEKANGDNLMREMLLSFGRVESVGSDKLLEGRVFEYNSTNGTFPDAAVENGELFVGGLVYGNGPDHPVSGMVIEGTIGSDIRIIQGVVEGGADPDTINDYSRDGGTQKGFAAGFMANESAGNATTYTRYQSNDVGDVLITKNVSTSNMGAIIEMENKTASANKHITAKFGTIGAIDKESAYLTDDLYAAEQGLVKYNDNGTITNRISSDGAIANATLLANENPSCNACDYVHWGVWGGQIDVGNTNTAQDVAAMIPYIAGDVTQNLSGVQAQSLGQVTYAGDMHGHVLGPGGLARESGTFTAGIDMNNRKLTDYNADFAGMNFGFSGQTHVLPQNGDAAFSAVTVTGVSNIGPMSTGVVGTINGALFGPNAENIGGTFVAEDTANATTATGVYLGAR